MNQYTAHHSYSSLSHVEPVKVLLLLKYLVCIFYVYPSPHTHSYTPLQEKDTSLYRPALEELRRLIRSSTTSMTSVPKPLKFLRPHYAKLKEIYEGMAPGENKVGPVRLQLD